MNDDITDDIVDRLRNGDARCGLGTDFAYPCKPGECEECDFARQAADEIERLRGVVEWLAEWACCDFTDDRRFGPVMTFDCYGSREANEDYPVPAVIADLLRAIHAKHGGVPQ